MINRNEYFTEYKKKHYKRVPLDIQPAKYEEIKTAASKQGESVNGFIKKAIDRRLESGD